MAWIKNKKHEDNATLASLVLMVLSSATGSMISQHLEPISPVNSEQGWNLSVEDERRLYLLISETLDEEGKAVESQKVGI